MIRSMPSDKGGLEPQCTHHTTYYHTSHVFVVYEQRCRLVSTGDG